MNLLASTYTEEFRASVANHNNEAWSRLIADLQTDIDDQFLKDSATLDKEQLHVENQKRHALQTLLTALTTNEE